MLKKNITKWERAHDRLKPEVWPYLEPKILAESKSKIFTIGSCFARNIEEHLEKLGFSIPMLKFHVPMSEWPERPNGILNKFSPASIYQEIEWVAKIYDRDGIVSGDDLSQISFKADDQYIDLQLGKYVPVSFKRLVERRQQVYDVFKEVFSSELIVLTLGLIEVWLDTKTNLAIQECPLTKKELRKETDRFIFKTLNHDECLDMLRRSIDLISRRNPRANFLLTVSPVPLSSTFTDNDVIIANMHSKAKLRSVCGEIVDNDKVYYFPSFESVILSKTWDVWNPDLIHVADAFVAKIINNLIGVHLDANESRTLYNQSFSSDSDLAIELLRDAIEKDEHSDYYERLGFLLIEKEEIEKAETCLNKSLELDPERYNSLILLSEIAIKEGNTEKAIALVSSAISKCPHEDSSLYMRLSDLLKSSGDRQGSFDSLKKACDINPFLLNRYIELSNQYAKAGNLTDAIIEVRKVILLKDDNPYFYHCLGNLLMKNGDIDNAEEAQKKAMALDPGMPGPYIQLSHYYVQREEHTKAVVKVREAIQLKDDNPNYYHYLGNLLMTTGDLDGAESAQKKAVELDPHMPGPHFQLSRIYARRDELDKALDKIHDAIALKNHNPNFYHYLGILCLRKGDLYRAEEAQKKAIELDPSKPAFKHALNKILAKKGVALI